MGQAAEESAQVEEDKLKKEEERRKLAEQEKIERRLMLNKWKVCLEN